MSAQAMGWALKQKIPGTAKLVLLALCNYADHRTGHCWPSVEIIAEEASCSRPSVFTYLAALQRNGYLEIQSAKRKTGEQRSNNYWVVLDREDTPWDFGKGANHADDPLDLVDGEVTDTQIAPSEDKHEVEIQPPDGAPVAHLALGQGANFAPPKENHLRIYPSESVLTDESERRSVAMRPALHDPRARKEEQARIKAAEAARKPKMVPVIQGTRAWAIKIQEGHNPNLVTTVIVNGEAKRGWYFTCLFRPKSTGPPTIDGAEFADEFDERETAEAE